MEEDKEKYRHTFVFCEDWFNGVKDYDDDVRLMFYEALCNFAFHGELPENNIIRALTSVPFLTIERNNEKFDATSAKRSKAGRAGGLKRVENLRKKQNEAKQANEANQANASKPKQNKQIKQSQGNENENENINENENEKKEESSFQESSSYKENKKRKVEKIPFDDFWNAYDKKVGNRSVVEQKWNKLSKAKQEEVMRVIPIYKKIQPDPQFRKNAETFLNPKKEPWKDEMFKEAAQQSQAPSPTHNYEGKEWTM